MKTFINHILLVRGLYVQFTGWKRNSPIYLVKLERTVSLLQPSG